MKKKFFLAAVASLIAAHCTHKETREPANVKNILTNDEAQALSNLMDTDSPLNPYRRPLKIQFHTSGDQEYFRQTAEKAFREALTKSLTEEGPEQGLGKSVTANLKEELFENFVETLLIYKIINIGIQVDISFLPEPYQNSDFSPELSSNQLVRFNEVGKLSRKWDALETPVTNDLFGNSFFVPKGQGDVDYVSGVLSLYVEILDMDPKLKLPNTIKNAVKGFVRYRRFYRLNSEPQSVAECGEFALSYKSDGPRVPFFYTVDLYKNFNLMNISPTEESLEIYPGFLASNNEGREELMPDVYEKAGRSISVGQLLVNKKQNSASPGFRLKKLVYDLRNKKLDFENSVFEQGKSLTSERRDYFKKCEQSLKTFLKLDAVVPGGLL